MISFENQNIEFKQEYVSDIRKEVIGFANADGGVVYVGIRKDGVVIGMEDPDSAMLQIVNSLKDSIAPDIMPFVKVQAEQMEGKHVVEIHVTTGTNRPYYLREKGLKPSGVYVRKGSSTQPMTEEGIREMIIENSGRSFESCRSMNQELTFKEFTAQMEARSIAIGSAQMKTLKLIGEDGLYTNLALLLSDQCETTIKVALFQGIDKEIFQNRKEFSGSILKQLEDAYEFIDLVNKTKFLGVSQSRNPNLAACFYRMRLIESYGTGIGKIQRAYKSELLQPEFETAKGVFRVTLPNRNETEKSGREFTQAESSKTKKNSGKQQQKVLEFVSKNGKITRKQVEELIGSGSTKAFKLIKELCEKGQMKAQGAGKHSYYVLA